MTDQQHDNAQQAARLTEEAFIRGLLFYRASAVAYYLEGLEEQDFYTPAAWNCVQAINARATTNTQRGAGKTPITAQVVLADMQNAGTLDNVTQRLLIEASTSTPPGLPDMEALAATLKEQRLRRALHALGLQLQDAADADSDTIQLAVNNCAYLQRLHARTCLGVEA